MADSRVQRLFLKGTADVSTAFREAAVTQIRCFPVPRLSGSQATYAVNAVIDDCPSVIEKLDLYKDFDGYVRIVGDRADRFVGVAVIQLDSHF